MSRSFGCRAAGEAAEEAAAELIEVLVDSFGVEPERSAEIRTETVAALGNPWFTHYLVRWHGSPAAVARRATFDGLTYLSSTGPRRRLAVAGLGGS